MTAPRTRRVGARRRWTIALSLAAISVAAAGCGATPSPSPSASTAPSASPAPSVAPGASATPLPAGSFTFDLPAGWKAVPVTGDDALIATLASQNATFAESLAARIAALPDSASYLAFDATPSVVAKGDLVTLIVTETPLPVDVTLQTFATTLQKQAEQVAEADLTLRQILVTAGQAYSLAYGAPLVRPDGQEGTVALTQVFYVLPGRGYVMTFAAQPGTAGDHAKDIADIATSFTIRT
jgi:hypothetical protein